MPLSQVDAVNIALQMIGESPVVSLGPAPTPTAAHAEAILNEVSREVQAEGWRFNKERDVELQAAVDGTITLVDVIEVSGQRWGRDLTLRGTRLFDVRANAYDEFSGTFKVDLTRELDWDDLPESAKLYIARRTGRVLSDRVFKDRTRSALAARDEQDARFALEKEEARGEPFTFLEALPQARILRRP